MIALGNWLRTLIAGAFLVSLVLTLAPKGNSTAALRFLTGVLMTLLLILPLAKPETDVIDWADMEKLRIAALEDEAEALTEKLYSSFIRRETEEYIWSAAEELGIETLGVSLTLDTDEAFPCPLEISLRGMYTEEQREALSARLESELGLSPERQHWSASDAD